MSARNPQDSRIYQTIHTGGKLQSAGIPSIDPVVAGHVLVRAYRLRRSSTDKHCFVDVPWIAEIGQVLKIAQADGSILF